MEHHSDIRTSKDEERTDLDSDGCMRESPNTKCKCEFTGDDISNMKVEEIVRKVDQLISSWANKQDEMNSGLMETYAKLVEAELECYLSGSIKIGQDSYKDEMLIESVSRIDKLMNLLVHDHNHNHNDIHFGGLVQTKLMFERTMSLMEEEVRKILEVYTSTNNETQKEEEEEFPCVSSDAICRMKVIARVMSSGGYETECCQVYSLLRRNAFKAAMKKKGFQKLNPDEITEMNWQQLELYITNWTKAVNHTAMVLFPREQHLCNLVFFHYPTVAQGIITNLARAIIIIFLNFVQQLTSSKQLEPETLFKLLQIYDSLTTLNQAMTSNDLKSEILSVQNRLGGDIITIFNNLEISIMNDQTTNNPIPNGVVHPLTRYTMNYLRYACDFKDTLHHIFNNKETKELPAGDEENGREKSSQSSAFATKLMRIMELLDANLDAKSNLYKDPSLSYVFLMNNGRYMLRKIKESVEMRELIGDISSRKRSTKLREYHKNYQRETWAKVLQCLSHQGIQVNGKVNKPLFKERLKNFNHLFEEIHRTQGTWVVSDQQLLSELRVSISSVVIPAYRSFLSSFKQHFIHGKDIDKYVKFQPEDIETVIENLFDGKPISSTRTRK